MVICGSDPNNSWGLFQKVDCLHILLHVEPEIRETQRFSFLHPKQDGSVDPVSETMVTMVTYDQSVTV